MQEVGVSAIKQQADERWWRRPEVGSHGRCRRGGGSGVRLATPPHQVLPRQMILRRPKYQIVCLDLLIFADFGASVLSAFLARENHFCRVLDVRVVTCTVLVVQTLAELWPS